MIVRKHLSFSSMRRYFSNLLLGCPDNRQNGKIKYLMHDVVMSGFACMYFQDPSLRAFQMRLEEKQQRNNLRTMFGVENIPKDSQMRNVLDSVNSEVFRPVFKELFNRLQRGKILKKFEVFPNTYLISLDATQYFSSEDIHCSQCLIAEHKNGKRTYSHSVLMAALMSPDMKQVIPMMPEEIKNSDGYTKQDCEINAAKRLIPAIRKDHPRLNFIVVGDGIYSRQPMIQLLHNEHCSYIFVAKPDDHKVLYRYLDTINMSKKIVVDEKKGKIHIYEWANNLPLNGNKETVTVNYFRYEVISTNKKGKKKVVYKNYWVTDITINEHNIEQLVKCARCRWKIENECFNTLKNQGYNIEHNYGHGENNLSFNFLILTLAAFSFHQILEITDILYQKVKQKKGSKRQMWESLRAYIQIIVFNSWEHLLDFTLNSKKYTTIPIYDP